MKNEKFKFGTFFWRITSSHMITYSIMGIIAANFLHYQEVFNSSETLRDYDSPWIPAGPGLQVIRGLIFSLALWYFKESFLYQKYGWLKLWGLIVGLSILSTAAASPGSIEGFIYTTIPVVDQIKGYIELVPQTGLFSVLVFYWYERPKKVWNILSIILISLIVLMSLMGVLAASGIIDKQIVKDATNSGTFLSRTDLWSPLNSDPKPRLYITAHFSECGEWGGHFEERTISLDESHQPNVDYERNMVKCDSVDPFTGFPYQILDYTKHLKLNSNGKKSIEDYISRLIRSKLGERYPGHAGNAFKIVNHDSTLIVVVYDNKLEDVNSYNQLLDELGLDKANE